MTLQSVMLTQHKMFVIFSPAHILFVDGGVANEIDGRKFRIQLRSVSNTFLRDGQYHKGRLYSKGFEVNYFLWMHIRYSNCIIGQHVNDPT